ncbi:Ig-like domain-containing protein [Microbacterium sp. NPDC089189]|uniref:Ig-like domain-containing protein n=1 Tax=Microbacterium sp. NPDC089189 TaxID=3154972 RepID=UPI00342E405F
MSAIRRVAAVTVTALLAAGVVSAGTIVAAEPAAAVSTPDAFEVTLTPQSLTDSFTVPASSGPLEITVSGAPGVGAGGGAGASYRFTTTAFEPGTVLDVRFGPRADGFYPALSAAAGGTGANTAGSGRAGGDATMILRHRDAISCGDAASQVVAIAGGGGGASGGYAVDASWLTSRDGSAVGRVVAGHPSRQWDAGSPWSVRAACEPGSGARGGENAQGYGFALNGGGGGGGGLSAGWGGSAQRDGEPARSESGPGRILDILASAIRPHTVIAATGGDAGTSYLAPSACGAACGVPAISAHTGPAAVTFRWTQQRTTRIDVDGAVGAAVERSGSLTGKVRQTWQNQGRVLEDGMMDGVVSAWLGDRLIDQARPRDGQGRFSLDLGRALARDERADVRLEFTPDTPAAYRGTTGTYQVVLRPSYPYFSIGTVTRQDAGGTTWLLVQFFPDTPPSIAVQNPPLTISTRAPGETSFTARGSVQTYTDARSSCALVALDGVPGQEIVASFGGDDWHRAAASAPYRHTPGPGTRVQDTWNWCTTSSLLTAPADSAAEPDAAATSAARTAAAPASDDETAAADIVWASPTDEVAPDAPVELAVDVRHAGVPTAEGIVEFLLDGVPLGQAQGDAQGRFRLALPAPAPGTAQVTAVYSDPADDTGERSHAGGVASHTLLVAPRAVEVSVDVVGIDTAAPGAPVTLRATARSASGPSPTGSISFFDDERYLATVPLAAGAAVLSDATLDGLTNTARAVFVSDASSRFVADDAASAADYSPVTTTARLIVAGTEASADADGEILLDVRRTGGTGAVTGEMTLWDGDTPLLVLDDDDAASSSADGATWEVPLSALAPGSHTLSAVFTGEAGVDTSRSEAIAFEVRARATSVTARIADGALRVEASVAQDGIGLSAGARPSGVAAVFDGDRLLGVAKVIDGTASIVAPEGRALRVEFRPLSTDLAASAAPVLADALAATGAPDASAWGVLAVAGFAAVAAGACLQRVRVRRR